jgi:HEAT repeat protein
MRDMGENGVAALTGLLDSENTSVVEYAIAALGDLKAVSSLDRIKGLYEKTNEPRLKASCSYALYVFTKEDKYFQEMCKSLKDKEHCGIAAVLLGKAGNPKAVEHLTQALSKAKSMDADTTVLRFCIAGALSDLGRQSRLPLLKLLDSNNGFAREGALIVLKDIGDSRDVVMLLKVLRKEEDKHRWEQIYAEEALSRICIKYGCKELIRVLGSEPKELRIEAAETLAFFGTMTILGTLIDSIKGNDKEVCEKIGEAIRYIVHRKHGTWVTNHGSDHKKWLDWYEKNKKWFKPKK